MSIQFYNIAWHANHSEQGHVAGLQYSNNQQNLTSITHAQFDEATKLNLREQIEQLKEAENDEIRDRERGSHSYYLLKRAKRGKKEETEVSDSGVGSVFDAKA